MNNLGRAVALGAALVLAAPGFPGRASAADEAPKPAEPAKKPEPPKPPTPEEVKEFCKGYEESLKKMVDGDAIAGVEKVRGWMANPGTPEEARKDILSMMRRVIDQKSREALLETACKALADFGEDGVKLALFVVQRSLAQKVPPSGVVRAGLTSLGKLASPGAADIKFLTDLVKTGKKEEKEFVGDCAKALAGYAKAPGAIRHDIFEEILKLAEGVFSKSENNDQNAKRDWNNFGQDLVEAMQKLSRTNFQKPPEFRKWFNDKSEKGGKNPRAWPDEPASGGK